MSVHEVPADPADQQRQSRGHELEGQAAALHLDPRSEPLPSARFDVLEVLVGSRWYLLPVSSITEVVAVPGWQPLPGAPAWVLGTFRFGRDVVVLLDTRGRIEGEPTAIDPSLLVVIVDRPRPTGLLVARVGDVVPIDPADVTPPRQGIPQAPYLVGAIPARGAEARHILAAERLAQDGARGDDG